MKSLKEQAQEYVDKIMNESRSLENDENFAEWKKENKGSDFIIRTDYNIDAYHNGEKVISCINPYELEKALYLGAEKHTVLGTIDANATCEECPWDSECE